MKACASCIILLALILGCPRAIFANSAASRANDSISVTGTVRQSFTRERIDGVFVQVLNCKDSSLVAKAYTADAMAEAKLQNGQASSIGKGEHIYYKLKVPAPGRYLLRVSLLGYAGKIVEINVPHTKRWLAPDVFIKEEVHTLGEVTVKASKLKMVMRGDTVVYNADLFQLAEGSMLDKLFQLMPGFEVKPGGAIYVNGKYVESLLVNGKDFFNGSPGVALENLPAYTVKEVKVYGKEDEAAYLNKNVHKSDEDKPLSVDVVLKKEYAQGWILNAEGGYGTHDVYSGRAFAMRYTDQSRLTLFGNVNNVNIAASPSDGGEWDDNATTSGRTIRKTGGLDFSLTSKWTHTKYYSTVVASREDNDLRNETSITTFLPAADTYSRQRSVTDERRTNVYWANKITHPGDKIYYRLNTNAEYDKTKNSTSALSAQFSSEPQESYRTASIDSIFASPSQSLLNILTNRNSQSALSEQKVWKASERFLAYIGHGSAGNTLSLSLSSDYQHRKSTSFMRDDLQYFDGQQGDYRHSLTNAPRTSFSLSAGAGYSVRLMENASVELNYKYNYEYGKSSRDYFRLDNLAQDDASSPLGVLPSNWAALQESVLDGSNSYVGRRSQNSHQIGVSFWRKFGNGASASVEMPLLYRNEHYTDIRQAYGSTPIKRNRYLFNPSMYYDWGKASTSKGFFRLKYGLENQLPDISLLVDVDDNTSTTVVKKGNPDLKMVKKHNAYLKYEKILTDKTLRLKVSYDLVQDAVAQALTYNTSTGVYTYQPRNIDGNWSLSGEAYWRKDLVRWKRWSYETTTRLAYANSSDFVSLDGGDASRSSVRNFCAEEQANATYRWDKMYLRIEADAAWNYATSQREGYQTRNSIDFGYGLAFNAELPWRFTFNTTLHMFCRRGYDDDSMNDDNLVWNASLSRPLDGKGHWTLKLRGNDILHQLSTVRRTLNAQGLTETWTNSLPSFFMATLSYKLHIMPKRR